MVKVLVTQAEQCHVDAINMSASCTDNPFQWIRRFRRDKHVGDKCSFNASEKRTDSVQPENFAQADLGLNFLLLTGIVDFWHHHCLDNSLV